MIFADTELAALQSDIVRIGAFMRLTTTTSIERLWAGVGQIAPPPDALDTGGGEIYTGTGLLVKIPPFQQLINGAADRVSFVLNATSSDIMALAASQSASIARQPCDFGIALFDQTWQLLGPIHFIRRGYADFVHLSTVGGKQTKNGMAIRTAALSSGSLFTGRRRRGISYLSDYDQRQISSDDSSCERTVMYSTLGQKNWP